jgi:hypothetical protein
MLSLQEEDEAAASERISAMFIGILMAIMETELEFALVDVVLVVSATLMLLLPLPGWIAVSLVFLRQFFYILS